MNADDPHIDHPTFSKGRWYRKLEVNSATICKEPTGFYPQPFSERHVQAVWFDSRFRPQNLTDIQGRSLHILHPGRWNTGPGPDFHDAELIVEGEHEPVRGDVEVDMAVSGWLQHGHHVNPDFTSVRLHVTYEVPETPLPELPDGVIELALKPFLDAEADFDFKQVDLSAYPFEIETSSHIAGDRIQSWPMSWKHHLLRAAGEARLLDKAERLSARLQQDDTSQVLYEEWMASLGYRRNQIPFRRLGRLVPLAAASSGAGSVDQCYAQFLGIAGLLPERPDKIDDPESREYVRGLWDIWWKHKEAFGETLERGDWDLRGIRPLNHPRRRLMAAALMVAQETDFFNGVYPSPEQSPDALLKTIETLSERLNHPFWSRRQSLLRPPSSTAHALLGQERLHLFWNNVILPLGHLQSDAETRESWLGRVQPEPLNRISRQAAHLLLGPDASRTLLSGGLARQGLMRLFEDFILVPQSSSVLTERLDALESALSRLDDLGADS